MRRSPLASFALSLALLIPLACQPTPDPVPPTDASVDVPAEPSAPELSAEAIQTSVAFLADDAQQGRPPGTEADARVQAWIVERMQAAGLEPGTCEGSLQTFEVGDGVRPRERRIASLGGPVGEIEHSIMPFGHLSADGERAATGKLVFVGHGIPGEGDDPGDFAGAKLEGAIAVVLVGSADPHAPPAKTRPQSKLIAARDRGAVGFVLWDPDSDVAWPNHGPYSELAIPAVFVGKSGSEVLRKALKAKPDALPKPGASSRKPFLLETPIEPVLLDTANVIGVLPGSGGGEGCEAKRIVVGAHMDHLGMGTSSSLAPGEVAVHNGADDNASGVAVMLALAEGFAALAPEHRPHDLVFVAFGAEEMGLLGSKYLVETMDGAERQRVLAMINFDMVGRLSTASALAVNGKGTAEEWEALISAANVGADGAAAMELGGTPDGWGPSDHAAFYGEGMPVLHFFTGSHDDYHKPSDDLDKLDSAGAASVGELAGRVILGLLDRCEPLTYVKVERPSQGRTAFRVSLGTMPDYGVDADGLALAGVRPGGAAEAAGLQKGDVLTKIGEREIHNIDDYMACFAELEPGVAVPIEYVRDGAKQTGELVPSAPRPH